MAAVAEEERRAAEHRLRYDTPFWAGGVTRDSSGRWVTPAPGAFQGCAKILDKRKLLVPAIAKPWQLELDEALEKQRAAGLPMRVLILKARKLGMSTWIALKFLQRVTQLADQAAVVVAQDVNTAGEILQMARRAYANLPTEDQLGMGFAIKPGLIGVGETKNGRQHMIFGEQSRVRRMEGAMGSSIFEIDTAGSPTSGRGTTPNLLHLSEVAFWESEQATRKMLAMLEALPYEQETICAIESTANGLNHFYRRWISAREGSTDPVRGEVYTPIFVPWWRDPDCSMRFPTAEERERFIESIGRTADLGELAEDEPMLVQLYGATPEQLLWRRMKIQEQPDKSVQTFNQENPHSDEVAFIGSGRTVFPSILITKAIKAAEAAPEPVSGVLRPAQEVERRSRSGTVIVPGAAVWVPAERAKPGEHLLRVWEHPRKAAIAPATVLEDGVEREATDFERRQGAYYVVADVASGEANTFSQGDYHAVKVYDHHTRAEVATHKSRMDIHELPIFLLLLAIYYNEARLMIEVNNQGIAVVSPLEKDYRYKKMFRRQRIDTVRNTRENKAGWETTDVTKPAMEVNLMGLLDSDVRDEGLVRDPETARQLTTYVIDEKGRHGAQAGEYDDLVVAWMIGQMGMAMKHPPKIGGKRVEGFKPKDPLTGY